MKRPYLSVLLCFLVMGFSSPAFAGEGHSLPWGDFLLRIINAAAFVGIIWYAAAKFIRKFFADKKDAVINEMDELAKRKQNAEERLAQVERQIANVEAECAALLEEGKAQAERLKEAILKEAHQQAEKIVDQAKANVKNANAAELDAIRKHMAESIIEEIKNNLNEKLDHDAHLKLIDKSLTKVVLQ